MADIEDQSLDIQRLVKSCKVFEQNASTYTADFKKCDLSNASGIAVVVAAKPAAKPKPKDMNALNFVHTMSKWKNRAPFSLYTHPNPVHGIDPRGAPKPCEPEPDEEREQVQKTRPHVVMPPPAVCLDAIDDSNTRAVLIEDTYLSTVVAAQQLTESVAFPTDRNLKSPLGTTFAPAKPISLPKWKPKYVSPEWRMESASWERQQNRTLVDANAVFLKRYKRIPAEFKTNRNNDINQSM